MALTFGVEEEFLVVDAASGALVPKAHELLAAARTTMGDSVTTEINLCQVEVSTGIVTDLSELRRELAGLRRSLADEAAGAGLAPLAAGTHPFSFWQDQHVDATIERYVQMEEKFQHLAREQVICGCHVHVGLENDDLRIEVMNRVRPWLPVLLALSANSPYWQGADTGYESYRTQVWQRWPTATMPPTLLNRAGYDAAVEELVTAGAIEDASHLYWYVRPSASYPTIEIRVCDVCLDVDDAVAIAGLIRALVWICAREPAQETVPPHSMDVLRSAMWRAARYGIGAQLIDPTTLHLKAASDVVARMLAYVTPGLEAHGDTQTVGDLIARILGRGTGARFQRLSGPQVDRPTVVQRMVEVTAGAAVSPNDGLQAPR